MRNTSSPFLVPRRALLLAGMMVVAASNVNATSAVPANHGTSASSSSAVSLRLTSNDDESDSKVSDDRLEEILGGETPKTVAELAAMEAHFKKLVEKVKPAIVGVRVGDSQGSGVIISRDGFVLTAGHVVGKANQDAVFILPGGSKLRGKTLGANFQIDSGLMQITEEGSYPYVDMGDSTELAQGQWVMAVGHPGGYEEGRTPVVRIGRILDENANSIRTDCALVGGDSGGPLFDMHGQVIGINSRIGEALTNNIHVPVNTYAETWSRLAAAEEWGSFRNTAARAARRPKIGVVRDTQASEARIAEVDEGGPADKAGVQPGDIIIQFDGRQISSFQSLINAVQEKTPGDEVEVVVRRDEQELNLKLIIGVRE